MSEIDHVPITLDILSMGRLAVDLYAREVGAPLASVASFNVYAGGCPTNLAVGARRLGLRVGMITRVGADGLSDGLVQFLEREGIDTAAVTRDPAHLTGLAFLAIQPPETFPLTYYRADPADLQLTIADVDAAAIARTRMLFVAGTNLNGDPSRAATLYAMEVARAAGVQVALDLDLRRSLWPEPRAFGVHLRTAVRLADIVIGTEEEIHAVGMERPGGHILSDTYLPPTQDTPPERYQAAYALLERGARIVAVKRGRAGATIFLREPDPFDAHGDRDRVRTFESAPYSVDVLNTLGAGDAWASGFLYGVLNGWDLQKAARFGNATGAYIVTQHACANDMPTLTQIEAFIGEQEKS